MSITKLFTTGFSARQYYRSLNYGYKEVFGKHLMLHYPLFNSHNETLEKRQRNLTDHCISKIDKVQNKTILEVGCGNGAQSIYVLDKYQPLKIIGIDLNPDNIQLANNNKKHRKKAEFYVDDAHKLELIEDGSIDVVLCIESALHYPNKELFLNQVKRVLKPTGEFVIADITNKSSKRKYFSRIWKKKMSYHHWTEKQYLQSFDKLDLEVEHKEDITSLIAKGYQGYRKWVTQHNFNNFINYILFKLFLIIHVSINVGMLRRKEDYFIFAGIKR